MRHFNWILVPYCLTIAICGCNSDPPPNSSQPASVSASQGVRAEDILGKWHLVRAGGKPPVELYINSQEIDIAKDGAWTSKIEFQKPHQPAEDITNQGTWSLAGGVIAIEGSDHKTGKSQVRVESGRLILDPDVFMAARKKGTDAVAGEYER